MPFWVDGAATLRQVFGILTADWSSLDEPVRDTLQELVTVYGPQIAEADRFNAVSKISQLLDHLWMKRDQMPKAVVDALQAAWAGAGAAAISRGIISVTADEQHALLMSMVGIADFRVFADPGGLAERVNALIRAHSDRLQEDERTRWQALSEAYAQNGDAVIYLKGLEALLGSYPQVHQMLEDGKVMAPPTRAVRRGLEMFARGPEVRMAVAAEPPPAAAAVEGQSAVLQRFVNVHFPATVLLSQRSVPLIVHVAQVLEQGGRVGSDQAAMSLRAGELTLLVHAEAFTLESTIGGEAVSGVPTARTVVVTAERDCEPVVFFLTPQTAGPKHIAIDIYQDQRSIASLGFDTEVGDQAVVTQLATVAVEAVPVVSVSQEAEPPDLELRVMLGGDGRTLMYYLHSPRSDDYNFQPAGQVTLLKDPRAYLQPQLDQLSTLAQTLSSERSPSETQSALQALSDIGQNLYNNLFSPELKEEYGRTLHERYMGKSVLITSDEPWIPWEMVRPFAVDRNGTVLYDDPPLCETFQISRWLAGRGAPDKVTMRSGVWVAPADNLKAAQAETDYFAELNRRQWTVSLSGPLSTLADVQSRFREGQTELYHFACHGNFNTDDPDESKLKLQDDFLRPSQITGTLQAGLLRSRPVVFLNACHSGEAGVALTQIGGWADRFISSGASAFIGSLWEINDHLAATFAQEFYNRVWGLQGFKPMQLGQAFHEARLAVKQLDPANPTWLAYVLYGDPRGSIQLGNGAS